MTISFKHYVKNIIKPREAGYPAEYFLFLALGTFTFNVYALSPSQVFEKVKSSVIVVETLDANGKTISQGSGVLLPSGKVGTNCHVVKNGASIRVGSGKQFVPATIWGSDEDKDICLLEATRLSGEAAQLGQASRLKVGEPVYAVGAPQGLELSLSDGIVSQLRGGPPPIIQTTAAISPGSSGGGLFDAEGRLVGFTSLYVEGGQSLNFAMPVEWAAEIQPGNTASQGTRTKAVVARSWADWERRTVAFEVAKNWIGMTDWCTRWTQAQPGNIFAWMYLSKALGELGRYTESIEAARQGIKINPRLAQAWISLGNAYAKPKRYSEAIEAYRQAIRVDPGDVIAWLDLGNAYLELKRYPEAIVVYQQLVRIDPKDADHWLLLALAYEESGNRNAAADALNQLRRIDPTLADRASKAMTSRIVVGSSAAVEWVRVGNTGSANDDFDYYVAPAAIRRSGNMVTMWHILDFKKTQIRSGKRYLSSKVHYEHDCKEERSRSLSFTDYSENMAKGKVVHSDQVDDMSKWISVAPESVGKRLWEFACRK